MAFLTNVTRPWPWLFFLIALFSAWGFAESIAAGAGMAALMLFFDWAACFLVLFAMWRIERSGEEP